MVILFIMSHNFFCSESFNNNVGKEMRKRDLKLCLKRFFLILCEHVNLRTDQYCLTRLFGVYCIVLR